LAAFFGFGSRLFHLQDCKAEFLTAAVLFFDPHHFGVGLEAFECRMIGIDPYAKAVTCLE
jgi:hypothetical protein